MVIEDTLNRIRQNTAQILEDFESIQRHFTDDEYDELLEMQPDLEALQEIISSYL